MNNIISIYLTNPNYQKLNSEANLYLGHRFHVGSSDLDKGATLLNLAVKILKEKDLDKRLRKDTVNICKKVITETNFSLPLMLFHRIFHSKSFKELTEKRYLIEQMLELKVTSSDIETHGSLLDLLAKKTLDNQEDLRKVTIITNKILEELRSPLSPEDRSQKLALAHSLLKKIKLSPLQKARYRISANMDFDAFNRAKNSLDEYEKQVEQLVELGINPNNLEKYRGILFGKDELFKKLQAGNFKSKDGEFTIPCYREQPIQVELNRIEPNSPAVAKQPEAVLDNLKKKKAMLVVRDGEGKPEYRNANDLEPPEFMKLVLDQENSKWKSVNVRLPLENGSGLKITELKKHQFASQQDEKPPTLTENIRFEHGALIRLPTADDAIYETFVEQIREHLSIPAPLTTDAIQQGSHFLKKLNQALKINELKEMELPFSSEQHAFLRQQAEKLFQKIEKSGANKTNYKIQNRSDYKLWRKIRNEYLALEDKLKKLEEIGVDPSLLNEHKEIFFEPGYIYNKIKAMNVDCTRDGKFGLPCFKETPFSEAFSLENNLKLNRNNLREGEKFEIFKLFQREKAQLIIHNREKGVRTERVDLENLSYEDFIQKIAGLEPNVLAIRSPILELEQFRLAQKADRSDPKLNEKLTEIFERVKGQGNNFFSLSKESPGKGMWGPLPPEPITLEFNDAEAFIRYVSDTENSLEDITWLDNSDNFYLFEDSQDSITLQNKIKKSELTSEGLIIRGDSSESDRITPYMYVDHPPDQPKLELLFHASKEQKLARNWGHVSIKITDTDGAVYSIGFVPGDEAKENALVSGALVSPDPFLFLPEDQFETYALEYNLGGDGIHPILNYIQDKWITETPKYHPLQQSCAFFTNEVIRIALENSASRSVAAKPLPSKSAFIRRIENASLKLILRAPLNQAKFPEPESFSEGRNIQPLPRGKTLLPSDFFLRQQAMFPETVP